MEFEAERPRPLKPWLGWFVLIVGAYVVVAIASALYGTPPKLPGIALGFPLLLHLERAGAVVAVVGATLVVARLAWLGELPNQLGNIGYASAERRHEFEHGVADLRRQFDDRLDRLELGREEVVRALPVVRTELADLDIRVRALEEPAKRELN